MFKNKQSTKQQAADEKAADDYAKELIAADLIADDEAQAQATAEPETEPERFASGGATADEIAAWRAEHGTVKASAQPAPGPDQGIVG